MHTHITDRAPDGADLSLYFRRSAKETETISAENAAATLLRVEGGWSAVLQIPRTRTEEEWTLKLLGEYDVLVQPGFFYDFESEAYLVLSLLTTPEMFREGLMRLLQCT